MCVFSLQPTLQAPKCQVPHRQRSKYGVSLRFEQRTVNDVLYKVRCSYSYEHMKWIVLWGFKADSPVWFIGPVEVMRLILRPFPAAMITLLNTCVRTELQASAHKMFWVFAPWKVCMLWREMQLWENSRAEHINFLEASSRAEDSKTVWSHRAAGLYNLWLLKLIFWGYFLPKLMFVLFFF